MPVRPASPVVLTPSRRASRTPGLQVIQSSSHHLLLSNLLAEVHFPIPYITSLDLDISLKFLTRNWEVFNNHNQLSNIRQTAMAYITSYLCRARSMNACCVTRWLEELSSWALNYVRTRDGFMDFMPTDISKHGPFYSACQAIFYVFTFRHSDLTSSKEKTPSVELMSTQHLTGEQYLYQ